MTFTKNNQAFYRNRHLQTSKAPLKSQAHGPKIIHERCVKSEGLSKF